MAGGAAPQDLVSSLRPSDVSVSALTCLATNEDDVGVLRVEGKGGGGEGKEGRC